MLDFDPDSRRLALYAGCLAACLGLGEGAARSFPDAWAAMGDRVAFKAALFARQGPTPRLVVGTSRLNDAVRARAIDAFNASVPSSSWQTQGRLAKGALSHPGLKLLVLEVSPEQLADEAPLSHPVEPSPFHLVTWRRALAFENWPRGLALLAPRLFDGSEWFRDRWLTEGLKDLGLKAMPKVSFVGRPLVRGADSVSPPTRWTQVLLAYESLVQTASATAIDTVFVVPPSAGPARSATCGGDFGDFAQALAIRTGKRVLDYGCLAVPDEFFSDGSTHLGALGRAWFTRSLGEEL